MKTSKALIFFGISAFLLFLLILAGLKNGAEQRSWAETAYAFFGSGEDADLEYFIRYLRLPRIVAAFSVGACLAVCGAVLQTVLKNALASPFTLGLSQGAAFGVTFAITLMGAGMIGNTGSGVMISSISAAVLCAFIGSLTAAAVIMGFSFVRGMTPQGLILAGVAVSAFFGACTMLLQFFATDTQVAASLFWTFGDIGKGGWREALTVLSVTALGTLAVLRYSWDYNAIIWGDLYAAGLGVSVKKIRIYTIIITSVMAAFATAFYGVIGFVGLIAPHTVRLIFRHTGHVFLITASAVTGGVFLLGADILAQKAAAPLVLPVGVLTSFAGVPLFLYLLIRRSVKND